MIQIRCPKCLASLDNIPGIESKSIVCEICAEVYANQSNFVDFIRPVDVGKFELQTINTWGDDLHKDGNNPGTRHIETMNQRLENLISTLKGCVLDLGCGSGYDTKYIANIDNVEEVIGLDIGSNCQQLAKRLRKNTKIKIIRGNCLNLPFQDNQFDYIYSYGVIHHTLNPLQALCEAKRVLKSTGLIYIYVYTSHSKNLLKKSGVVLESLIMLITSRLSKKYKNLFCKILSYICWFSFSIPALILKSLGKKDFAEKIPMHWGTTPQSVLPDIKDRLLAPVNHRYSADKINKLIKKAGLVTTYLKEDHTGIYISASNLSYQDNN